MIDLVAANHTNRELELMLEGRKPLAMFYAELAELPDEELIPEERFAPYVSKGQFIRGETTVSGSFSEKLGRKTQIRFVFFALREEAWRVAAMKLLKEQHHKTNAWNETCERAECVLLGYTDEETDAWCKKAFAK
ncbi:MAG: hypothetical protein IPM58_18520 [Nitrospira sp.]|nr:hypothetical protein [Nitrospira sp.]